MPNIGELLKKAREKRGWTREQAAANMDFLEVRTLAAYENGEYMPKWDVIPLIARAYGDKRMLFKCLQENPVYRAILPPLKERTLEGATCNVVNKLARVRAHIETASGIVSDGAVDAGELPDWRKITEDVTLLIAALLEFAAADGRWEQ